MTTVMLVGALAGLGILLLLLQYDTGGYLARWYEGYLVPSRSTVSSNVVGGWTGWNTASSAGDLSTVPVCVITRDGNR